MDTKLCNPRREAVFNDWPSGRVRVNCRFWIESDPKRGERVYRQTEDKNGRPCKPKQKTYCTRACIVDGDDGRTYLLEQSGNFGFITIASHDMKYDVETVHEGDNPSYYTELSGLLGAAS